jgi:hypothetical protein
VQQPIIDTRCWQLLPAHPKPDSYQDHSQVHPRLFKKLLAPFFYFHFLPLFILPHFPPTILFLLPPLSALFKLRRVSLFAVGAHLAFLLSRHLRVSW